MDRIPTVLFLNPGYSSFDEERAVLGDARFVFLPRDGIGRAAERETSLARDLAAEADAVMVNLERIDADAIARLENCRVISRYGVGCDNVDVDAATRAGIWVANVPGYCDDEVAEHALALLLDLSRGISRGDRSTREGRWEPGRGRRALAGSTLGVAGFGGTAKAFARKCAGLGFREILSWSPRVSGADAERRIEEEFRDLSPERRPRPVGFDELLILSDAISVHLPLLPATRGLFGAEALSRMKRDAFLVNVSRGGIVDEDALSRALREGRLGGAGLDAFSAEPLPPDSPLADCPRLTLSPHTAFYSPRALSELKRRAAENVAETLAAGAPRWAVNRPAGR